MSVKEKVVGDITNEQAETEGPRRSPRSLNRKRVEAASKDERTSFDQNNNTGQVEDGLFRDVPIQGVVGSKRGRGRSSRRGGGKGVPSNRSGKGKEKRLLTRLFGMEGQPPRQIDSLSRTLLLRAARGNKHAQKGLQIQSPRADDSARSEAGGATEQQGAAMRFDAGVKPESSQQDNDLVITFENHPRTPEALRSMEALSRLEMLKVKKRKLEVEAEEVEKEMEAQKRIVMARLD